MLQQDRSAVGTSDVRAWAARWHAPRAVLVIDLVGPGGSSQPWPDQLDAMLPPVPAARRCAVGDGLLLEFPQVSGALDFGLQLSQRFDALHAGGGTGARLRIAGRLAEAVDAALADDAHLAQQARALAQAADAARPDGDGGFIVSADFAAQVAPGDLQDLGDVDVGHDARPQRAYRVAPEHPLLRATAPDADRAGIVVVPFAGRQAGSDDAVLGQVLADDLIAALGPVPGLRVISRLSSQWLAHGAAADRQLAQLPGVQFQLRGSYLVRGGEVRIFFNLVDLRSGEVILSDRFDTGLVDLLAGDGMACARIATQASRVLVRREAERARGLPLQQLESFSLLFGAIGLMHQLQRQDFEQAGAMLRHLIARHPRTAAPRAWLGQWHVLRVAQGWSADPAADAADASAILATALDLEPDHALSLAVDGLICAYVRRDLDLAGERYAAALRANPNEGLALLFRAAWHAYRGEGVAAVRCAFDAQDLSPLDPLRYFYDNFTSTALLSTDDFDGAIAYGRRSMRANRSHGPTLRVLAIALALDGRLDEARDVAATLMQLEPGFTASQFADRYPGVQASRTARYADALRQAGVPP